MSSNQIGQLPQSFRGYVGLAVESTFGTGVAPGTYVDATSDGFELDNQPEFQNTTRSRATHKAEAGPLSDEGSVDLPANPENGLGILLAAALGSESFSEGSSASVGVHTFTPDDSLPSLSVEVDRDTDVVRHLGCGVDTLELEHAAEEMLTASADVIAKEPDPSVSSTTPGYSDLRNFRWNDGTMTFNGTDRTADLQDVTWSIENGMGSEYRGARTLGKISVGERPITATATLDFETTELFEQFLGAADATSPQDQLATVGVNLKWSTPETIASSSDNYALEVDMPTCSVNTHSANIDQNSLVAEEVEFRAIVDDTLGAEAEVTLTNGVTEAYV
jgi:hypothetical protein